MIKMLIYVDNETRERLRRIAFERRRSMAAIIREAVDCWLRKEKPAKGGGKR